MSTRSIVGIKSESGYVGRYCHSDGYPDGILPVLGEVITRDGAQTVGTTLLSADRGGWSYLSVDYTSNSLGADRAKLVDGYGLQYLDGQQEKRPISLAEAEANGGIEYMYFVNTETGEVEWKPNDHSPLRSWAPGDDIPEEG